MKVQAVKLESTMLMSLDPPITTAARGAVFQHLHLPIITLAIFLAGFSNSIIPNTSGSTARI
jgi:hypothetical protein